MCGGGGLLPHIDAHNGGNACSNSHCMFTLENGFEEKKTNASIIMVCVSS